MFSEHRLGRGLQGYLIPFATHAFVPQRQNKPRKLPSPLVFSRRSLDFTPPPEIPLSSAYLHLVSILSTSSVERRDFTGNLTKRLRTLYAQ